MIFTNLYKLKKEIAFQDTFTMIVFNITDNSLNIHKYSLY